MDGSMEKLDMVHYTMEWNYPLVHTGEISSRPPTDTKIHGCSSTFYKVTQNLSITHAHNPIYFKIISRLLIITNTIKTVATLNCLGNNDKRKGLYLFKIHVIIFSNIFGSIVG
jgi:hypothetical protein